MLGLGFHLSERRLAARAVQHTGSSRERLTARGQRRAGSGPLTGSRFGMNSGATQRAVELQLAAADPTRPTVRGLAVESGARRMQKAETI